MSLNPKYIPLYNLQQYFVDKITGAPLSGGKVYFYSDVNRSIPKTVYELSSQSGTYTYVALPNPVNLSSVGTPIDDSGADIVIYAYPYDDFGNIELYYVVVQSALGQVQFTREAVPSSLVGTTPSSDAGIYNYIPNGQFLSHTDLPDNGLLVAGTNVTAQGGWSAELNDPIFSENFYTFSSIGFTENPTNSPRYLARFTANTISGSDSLKSIRIKWNDVNKFCANDDFYTFAFWAEANVNVPISINIVKYFGTSGSPTEIITKFTDVITTTGQIYQYQFQFGNNDGKIIDLINQDDFIAIEISLPLNIGFTLDHTDFVLANGQTIITSFPLQTNADMLTRGVAGWMDKPLPNGFDLYLPLILTRKGMMFDSSTIGKIEMATRIFPLPTDISAAEVDANNMPCDGTSYFSDDYSTIGIPFKRLGDYLIQYSPVSGVPLYGTGLDFATAYLLEGKDDELRLTVNDNGAGSTAASDGNTGWNIGSIVTYNGSTTGSTSLTYLAYNNIADTLLCIRNEPYGTAALFAPSAGTTPFTVTVLDEYIGLLAQQHGAFTLLCTAASTLVAGSGNPGLYWTFTTSTVTYYMWFYFSGETDPAPGGYTFGIKVDLVSTYTAQDVANVIREAMNAYQISIVEATGVPTPGQYWLFSTDPGSPQNFYAWYSVDNVGADPLLAGRVGIEIKLTASDTIQTTIVKTQLGIDAFKFASPDFRGMFPRGIDFTGIYDLDVAQRWSTVSGLSGANLGTFEYSQLLEHIHTARAYAPSPDIGNTGVPAGIGSFLGINSTTINETGGSETRPVNFYVNFVIKY